MDELLVDELADYILLHSVEAIEALAYQDKPLLESILIQYVRRDEGDRKRIKSV